MNQSSASPGASATSSTASLTDAQVDGSIDLVSPDVPQRRRVAGDVCAIFVHAGAGYHSLQNEKVHLAACEDAARSAMAFLNNGASAVDAVEIAIKVLEDKEITNAGFGSNLSIEGAVECDATIVDHYGRSGAVGAAGCIRNPIHLARVVLEHSTKPLSLRRVPPNLLVGPGATDFASEVGIPIVHPDYLVSEAAGERYARWKLDLSKVESTAGDSDLESNAPTSKVESLGVSCKSDTLNVELAGCWNESQPYSPLVPASDSANGSTRHGDNTVSESKKRHHWTSNETGNDGQFSIKHQGDVDEKDEESSVNDSPYSFHPRPTPRSLVQPSPTPNSDFRNSLDEDDCKLPDPLVPPPSIEVTTPSATNTSRSSSRPTRIEALIHRGSRSDDITDTVGAIAVDCFGNLAAGSSSGGIGMKHKGRVGPAALVGIGTAVIPFDPEDKEKTSVATVTSGTGEHMATTMAAGTCASRLYSSTRKTKRGGSESTDDDTAIRAFVEREFMGHPSVKHSHSAGAIGILGVKKTVDGVSLYFAHNTDSFAVASMSTNDKDPRSVMSRGKGDGQVVHGGRVVKHHRWHSPYRKTWPANPEDGPSSEAEKPPPAKKQKTKRVPRGPLDRPQKAENSPHHASDELRKSIQRGN